MSEYFEQVNAWLSELTGDPATRLSQNGTCYFQADEKVEIVLSVNPESGQAVITTYLLSTRDCSTEQVLSQSLSLNLYQQQTRGASICFSEAYNALVLKFVTDVTKIEYQGFINILNNLIAQTSNLKELLLEADLTITTEGSEVSVQADVLIRA